MTTERDIVRAKHKSLLILVIIATIILVGFLVSMKFKNDYMRKHGGCDKLLLSLQDAFGKLNNNAKYQLEAMSQHDTERLIRLKQDSNDIVYELVSVLGKARNIGCASEWFEGSTK